MKTHLQGRFLSQVRRALTLIELVVVMVILAAVAGIVLPLLPNMITRAHTTTSATNTTEVAKAIQTHEALYLGYPNNLDSLVDEAGALPTYLPGNTSSDLTTIAALSVGIVNALNASGITTMAQMKASGNGDFSPTFFPYGNDSSVTPTATTITTSTPLALLLGSAAQREFGTPSGATYIVFGLGSRSSMQGKTLQEPPVHFTDDQGTTPNLSYNRYGAVFQVTDAAGDPLDRAKLIGICAFHSDKIISLNDELSEYWSTTKN